MAKGWLIGGGIFLAVLLVASIAVALFQQETELPEGTPEATVQDFLRAAEAKDYQLAYDFLSEDIKRGCTLADFASSRSGFNDNLLRNERITFQESNVIDETAFVTMRISQFDRNGLFVSSEYSYPQSFTLKMENGEWRFSDYPWPFYCFNRIPTPIPVEPTPAREPADPTPINEPAPQ